MDDILYEYPSPIGVLQIRIKDNAIVALHIAGNQPEWDEQSRKDSCCIIKQESESLWQQTRQQLDEYFSGKRKVFDLPICLEGTAFQKKVWAALLTIPYGETRSYGEIARQIGNPKGVRAVGGANHCNPIMIIVPCHRVIGADGSLTGFGGGLPAKKYLLEVEKQKNNQIFSG